jgi:hypothetical protein
MLICRVLDSKIVPPGPPGRVSPEYLIHTKVVHIALERYLPALRTFNWRHLCTMPRPPYSITAPPRLRLRQHRHVILTSRPKR